MTRHLTILLLLLALALQGAGVQWHAHHHAGDVLPDDTARAGAHDHSLHLGSTALDTHEGEFHLASIGSIDLLRISSPGDVMTAPSQVLIAFALLIVLLVPALRHPHHHRLRVLPPSSDCHRFLPPLRAPPL